MKLTLRQALQNSLLVMRRAQQNPAVGRLLLPGAIACAERALGLEESYDVAREKQASQQEQA